MNQQNKTERWEERFDDEFWYDIDSQEWCSTKYTPGNDFIDDIKDFISQLLSDARREEREQVIGELEKWLQNYPVEEPGVFDCIDVQTATLSLSRYIKSLDNIKALTTAEESIKNLK